MGIISTGQVSGFSYSFDNGDSWQTFTHELEPTPPMMHPVLGSDEMRNIADPSKSLGTTADGTPMYQGSNGETYYLCGVYLIPTERLRYQHPQGQIVCKVDPFIEYSATWETSLTKRDFKKIKKFFKAHVLPEIHFNYTRTNQVPQVATATTFIKDYFSDVGEYIRSKVSDNGI